MKEIKSYVVQVELVFVKFKVLRQGDCFRVKTDTFEGVLPVSYEGLGEGVVGKEDSCGTLALAMFRWIRIKAGPAISVRVTRFRFFRRLRHYRFLFKQSRS